VWKFGKYGAQESGLSATRWTHDKDHDLRAALQVSASR
jgi:hypothetical protein